MQTLTLMHEILCRLPQGQLEPFRRRWRQVRKAQHEAKRFIEAVCVRVGLEICALASRELFDNVDISRIDVPIFGVPGVRYWSYRIWTPQIGCLGPVIGFDTETEAITDEGMIPRLVVATAFDGECGWLIAPCHVGAFLEAHRQSILVMHNWAFDQAVVLQACGVDLCDWLEQTALIDTGALYQLLRLGEIGTVPRKWALDVVAGELLGITLLKEDDVRLGFGQFLNGDGSVEIDALPEEFRDYALCDPAVTYQIAQALWARAKELAKKHGTEPRCLLSHGIQAAAAYALASVRRNGLAIDQEGVDDLDRSLGEEMEVLQQELKERFGWWSGKGEQQRFAARMAKIEGELGVTVPRTGKTERYTRSAEALSKYDHPFCTAFLRYTGLRKLRSTYLSPLKDQAAIHPSFVTLVDTGRTACRKPNVQNLPRVDRFRGLLVPRRRHLFLAADYSTAELCALAQICFRRDGKSVMRDLINAGTDLHTWFAARITGKSLATVTKAERQRAKAANFGFPGGLGIQRFREMAATNYELDLTEAEAKELKNAWLEAFPEVKRHLDDRQLPGTFLCDCEANPSRWPRDIAWGALLRVARGQPCAAKTGRPYPRTFTTWAWRMLETWDFTGKDRFLDDITHRRGTRDLCDALNREVVVWPSGRIRPDCTYCEARNGPFQGLVADGAKLALYRLVREGFRVVNFIHDEVVVELPEEADHLALARRIEAIMIGEMQRVIPDVRISVEYALMRRWAKSAEAVFDDPDSPTRLLVWEPAGGSGSDAPDADQPRTSMNL